MSWDSDEMSVQGSRPRELWKIETSSTTYRYATSTDDDVVFPGDSQTYTKIAGMRGEIAGAGVGEPTEIVFFVEPTLPAFQQNAFSMPRAFMTITVYRLQTGLTWKTIWTGNITDFSVDDEGNGQMRAPSIVADPLDTQVPGAYMSRLCNHMLFDPRCTINRALSANHVNTTASGPMSGTTLTVASIGGKPNHWADNGEVILSTNTNERRQITSQLGNVLTLNAPFCDGDVTGGTTLIVYAGCDHTIDGAQGCVKKYANAVNFGGHPHTTPVNPFFGDIRGYPWLGR
jgi:uncharacterized phage protein (TIGR02218 family)